MRPVSISMPSRVGLENSNFINPDLTWNRVSKGQRSAARRSRKPAGSLDSSIQQDDKSPNRLEDFSVSESEELGVVVLGRRFADKVEKNVPIKKRRLVLQSPLLPQQTPSPRDEELLSLECRTPSPHTDEPKGPFLDEDKCAVGQLYCPKSVSNQRVEPFDGSTVVKRCQGTVGVMSGKLSEVADGNNSYTDDFSGIALLAAAACNNIFDDEVDNAQKSPLMEGSLTPEGIDSSESAIPLKENIASAGKGDVSVLGLLVSDDGLDVQQNHQNDKDDGQVKELRCSKVERFRWDLNTVMEDACEQPCDAISVDTQIYITGSFHDDAGPDENLENFEDCEIENDPENKRAQSSYKIVSGHNNYKLVNSSATSIGICESNSLVEASSDAECSERKQFSASSECGQKPLHSRATAMAISAETSLDNSSCSESDHILTTVSLEKVNTTSACIFMQSVEDCCRTSALEDVQVGKRRDFISDTSVPHKVRCEIGCLQNKDGDDSAKTSGGLPDNRTSPHDIVSSVTDTELSINNFSKLSAPIDKNSPALDAYTEEGQLVVSEGTKGHGDQASVLNTTSDDSLLLDMPKSYDGKDLNYHSGKIDLGDPDEGDIPDATHDGQGGNMVDMDNMARTHADYDSPYEDGELRESVLYSWEEKEAEWETECVDYESDNGGGDDFDTADYPVSEKVEQCGREEVSKESCHSVSLKTKISGWDQLPEGCEYSIDRSGEMNDENARKLFTSDCMDGLNDKVSPTGEVGLKTSRGCFVSYIEEKSHPGLFHRKDGGYIRRSRSNNRDDSYFRAGRGDFNSVKALGRDRAELQMHNRSQVDGNNWVNYSEGYRDSRNQYSTCFRPYDSRQTRPRSNVANSVGKVERLACRDPREPINCSSKGGVYRLRSSTDREDIYGGANRGFMPARDLNSVRGQGRFRVHPQGVSRGPREDYCSRPMPADPSSSVRVSPYIANRERSFSPIHNRGGASYFPRNRRRSRSRSRSHSPVTWHLQQERNLGMRRYNNSRSPDFRSEVRMKRIRFPNQKSSFAAADEEERFMSTPRGRFFPQCNSRWVGERNFVTDRFRGRRSPPVRNFRRNQRLETSNSPERLKSENCFRPMGRPAGRYPEMAGDRDRRHEV